MGTLEAYWGLIIVLLLGCAGGCSGADPRYHIEVGQVSGSNAELRSYYELHGEVNPGHSGSPAFQELQIGDLEILIADSNVLVKDVLISGEEGFVLLLNNFGYHIARICREGKIEYAADLSEVPVGDYSSISVRKESRTFVFRIEHGVVVGSGERKVLEKRLFSERAFDGCGPVLPLSEP